MESYKSKFQEAETADQEFGQEETALRNFNAIRGQIPFPLGSMVRVTYGDKGFQSDFVGKFKLSGGMITILGKKNDSQKFMANRMKDIMVDQINLSFKIRCSTTYSIPVQIHEEI